MALDIGSGTVVATLVIFAIGLLVGVVVKKTLKLGVAILALVILLAATGYINLSLSDATKTTIYRAFSLAPTIAGQVGAVSTFLPITSAAFLVGLAIGIWKG